MHIHNELFIYVLIFFLRVEKIERDVDNPGEKYAWEGKTNCCNHINFRIAWNGWLVHCMGFNVERCFWGHVAPKQELKRNTK